MRVRDAMTATVHTVEYTTPLKDAARLLADLGISGMPVVDATGRVVGVLSEGDILIKETGVPPKPGLVERLVPLASRELDPKLAATTAGEAMTAPALTIGPGRPLAEAARVMVDLGVNRLPVVDDAGALVGIVTRADLVRAFVRSDEEIARDIREEVLRRTLWIEEGKVRVEVHEGEVQLTGEVETKTDAELVPSLVQRTPGVISVLSKLRWREEPKRGRLFVP